MEINSALDSIVSLDPSSKEYERAVKNIETLCKAKSYEKSINVPVEALIAVAGNLLGIGLILNFEKLDIITTKALGFVIKGRV